jgi:hypothetical protein
MSLPKTTLAAALMFATLPAVVSAQARAEDEAAARAPLEAYIQGHRTGDASFMEKAFHPTARMTYMSDSGMVTVPITEYIARMRTAGVRAAPDTFPRKIGMFDVVGTAAVGRIDMVLGTSTISDYMTVLKFADGWKIVNKSFHRAAR